MKVALPTQLDARLVETGDPRAIGQGARFDEVMKKYPLEGSSASLDEDYGVRE